MHGFLRLAPEPGVVEPFAEDRAGVEVADQQRLLEGRRVRDDLALRSVDEAVAVEDELVLPAAGVDPCHERPGIHRAGPDHRLARLPLACVVGRAVDVHEQLRAVQRLDRERPARIPGVLADADPDPHALVDEDRAARAAAEVALLVEDPVVGQVVLVVDALDLAVGSEGGGVVDVVLHVDEADDQGDPLRGRGDLLQLAEVVADEARLEEQVLGRVAGQEQLREGDQVGAGFTGTLGPLDDLATVSFEVANGRVELGEGDPEHPRIGLHECILPRIGPEPNSRPGEEGPPRWSGCSRPGARS